MRLARRRFLAVASLAAAAPRAHASHPARAAETRVLAGPESLASGFDSPEGPAFGPDGALFFVNWNSSQILRLDAGGAVTEWFDTGGIPAGLAWGPDGALYVADEGPEIHGILRIGPDQRAEVVANELDGQPLNGANDLVFAADGTLYFSDPWGSGPDNPTGGFLRRRPDGTLERLDDGLAFPNGVALAADGRAVFLAESGRGRVLRYRIGRDGTVGPRRVWAELEPGGDPDGMAFDADGALYVARYGGGRIDVLDDAGTTIDRIPVPGANVTNLAFGGTDGRTLVVTEVETVSLYRYTMAVAGQPLHDGRAGS